VRVSVGLGSDLVNDDVHQVGSLLGGRDLPVQVGAVFHLDCHLLFGGFDSWSCQYRDVAARWPKEGTNISWEATATPAVAPRGRGGRGTNGTPTLVGGHSLPQPPINVNVSQARHLAGEETHS